MASESRGFSKWIAIGFVAAACLVAAIKLFQPFERRRAPATPSGLEVHAPALLGQAAEIGPRVALSAKEVSLSERDGRQLAANVQAIVDSYAKADSSDYLAFIGGLGVPLAPEINGPPTLEEFWPICTSMFQGATFDLEHVKVRFAYRTGEPQPSAEQRINRAAISRASAGQPELDPATQKADAVDVSIPGVFYSALDRRSTFSGTLVLGFMRRSNDGRWIPYKSEINGWPVGIRVVHPPL